MKPPQPLQEGRSKPNLQHGQNLGGCDQGRKVYKDHYIPMNRSMWEDLNHGLITKPELLRTRFSRLFEHFGQEVDGSHLAGRYQHFLSQQGQELPQAHAFLSNVKNRGHNPAIYKQRNTKGRPAGHPLRFMKNKYCLLNRLLLYPLNLKESLK